MENLRPWFFILDRVDIQVVLENIQFQKIKLNDSKDKGLLDVDDIYIFKNCGCDQTV